MKNNGKKILKKGIWLNKKGIWLNKKEKLKKLKL